MLYKRSFSVSWLLKATLKGVYQRNHYLEEIMAYVNVFIKAGYNAWGKLQIHWDKYGFECSAGGMPSGLSVEEAEAAIENFKNAGFSHCLFKMLRISRGRGQSMQVFFVHATWDNIEKFVTSLSVFLSSANQSNYKLGEWLYNYAQAHKYFQCDVKGYYDPRYAPGHVNREHLQYDAGLQQPQSLHSIQASLGAQPVASGAGLQPSQIVPQPLHSIQAPQPQQFLQSPQLMPGASVPVAALQHPSQIAPQPQPLHSMHAPQPPLAASADMGQSSNGKYMLVGTTVSGSSLPLLEVALVSSGAIVSQPQMVSEPV